MASITFRTAGADKDATVEEIVESIEAQMAYAATKGETTTITVGTPGVVFEIDTGSFQVSAKG